MASAGSIGEELKREGEILIPTVETQLKQNQRIRERLVKEYQDAS